MSWVQRDGTSTVCSLRARPFIILVRSAFSKVEIKYSLQDFPWNKWKADWSFKPFWLMPPSSGEKIIFTFVHIWWIFLRVRQEGGTAYLWLPVVWRERYHLIKEISRFGIIFMTFKCYGRFILCYKLSEMRGGASQTWKHPRKLVVIGLSIISLQILVHLLFGFVVVRQSRALSENCFILRYVHC